MKSDRSDYLLVKYFDHSINTDEMAELESWLKQPGNKNIFQDYARINYSVDHKLSEYKTEEVKVYLQKKIIQDKKALVRKRFYKIAAYAAVIAIIFGIFYFYQPGLVVPTTTVPQENEGSITLELGNGQSVVLEEEAIRDIVSEKGQIIGKQTKEGIQYGGGGDAELVYNTLKVPYGKTFQLIFSDGTKVFLNAGSAIKFPVTFMNGSNRTVFLSGEAFFEVSKSIDPFVVNTDNLNIEVLGTQFNVSAYPDEASIHTVLVEGSVKLQGKNVRSDLSLVLLPEYEAVWNRGDDKMEVTKADIMSTTAWMNGQLVFRGVAFKDIVKKLERSYNCTIINNNKPLDEEIFSATFNVDIESIEQVMAYISKNSPFQYTISKDRIITIN